VREAGKYVDAGREQGYDEAVVRDYANLGGLYDLYEEAMKTIPEGSGIVLTNTQTPLGWVNLVQSRYTKLLALGDEDLEPGAHISVEERSGALARADRVLSKQAGKGLCERLGIIPLERVAATTGD
jgi:hypothetical protein